MTKTDTSPKRAIILNFTLFLAVLLGLFSIQMKGALDGFDRWVGHEDHRMPNIRLVPKGCRWSVIERFIDIQPLNEADAIIFGDSQMFARGATQNEIFYTQWLGETATVINVSFLAASISDMAKIADELGRRGITVPITLQNVNLTHFIKPPGLDENRVENSDNAAVRLKRLAEQLNKRVLLPSRPSRLSRLYKNRYICAFQMRKEFSKETLRTPRYRKLLTKFSKVKLPDFYVTFYDKDFYDSVPRHIESFKNISPRTILITAPMAYDKFELYDFDIENLDKFAAAFQTLCDEHKTIECHDLTQSITSEGFMDLIHMNAVGHKLLGQDLKQKVPKD